MNVARRLHGIDRKRREILDAATALSPAELLAHATPASWSVLQVIEHLVVAEAAVMGDLAAAEQRPDRPRRLRHLIRYGIVMAVLRFRIRVSIPTEAMAPTGDRPLVELRAQWEGQYEALQALVQRLGRHGVRRPIFRHPVAGPVNMIQTIRMLDAHIDAHRRQLGRLGLQLGAGRSG
jgi:hypothetical protein